MLNEPARSESTFARAVHSRSHIHTLGATARGTKEASFLPSRLFLPFTDDGDGLGTRLLLS